jgi:hypothetical protein
MVTEASKQRPDQTEKTRSQYKTHHTRKGEVEEEEEREKTRKEKGK